jgi:hypothetical protein
MIRLFQKPSIQLVPTTRQVLRPVRSAESLIQDPANPLGGAAATITATLRPRPMSHMAGQKSSSRKVSAMDLDELAPLELVQRAVRESAASRYSPKMHSRSSSHDSYFEARLKQLGGDLDMSQADESVQSPSQLDLSELQMNFDLEENEMKIFSEDEAMMTESAISELELASKSPLTEDYKSVGAGASVKRSILLENGPDGSPKCRKMSFKEKFKRFTSPTPNRKTEAANAAPAAAEAEEPPASKKTIREKLVCALSPESLRKKTDLDGSPQKKKRAMPSTAAVDVDADLVKIDIQDREQEDAEAVAVASDSEPPKSLMLMSPSINFIDALPNESAAYEEDEEEKKTAPTGTTPPNVTMNTEYYTLHICSADPKSNRISTTYSTDDDYASGPAMASALLDQLVIAQVHHNPLPECKDEDTDLGDSGKLHKLFLEQFLSKQFPTSYFL